MLGLFESVYNVRTFPKICHANEDNAYFMPVNITKGGDL